MHEAYYEAVDGENYKEANRIALVYIDEAIAKAKGAEKTRLEGLKKTMSFDPTNADLSIKERTIANLHHIYAGLSRVSMTENKHLTTDGAKTELDDLIAALPGQYTAATKAKLKEI